MLEFELAIEAVQQEVIRGRQVLSTLIQRQPEKNTTPTYQKKAEELDTFLNTSNEILKRYHNIPLAEAAAQESEIQKEFFSLLDKLLTPEQWQSQTLLQAVCQQIKKTYDRLLEQEGKKAPDVKATQAAVLAEQRATMTKVFISLYQADGFNMKKWAALLEVVGDLSSSRPVYQLEDDVQSVIRTKDQKQKEGYAVMYISPKAILPTAKGQTTQDKSGHALVFLKEGSLRPENIIYFEHITGRYTFQEGALVRQEDGSLQMKF